MQIVICTADSDIFKPLISPNTPRFWDYTPTVSAPRLHTKQCVHQETYTADPTDHSPVVKLQNNHIVQLLF